MANILPRLDLIVSLPIYVHSNIQLNHVMGNVGVGRVGQEALQKAIAGTVFRRPTEDHLLCGYAQQSGKQQHHNRHV